MIRPMTALMLFVLPNLVAADISVQFIEGAPKDRFVVAAVACGYDAGKIEVDLSTAPAGLIFDVTAAGAGVEVYQPVELVSGSAAISEITDGDQVLGLTFDDLDTGSEIVVTTDIDDTLTDGPSGQIIVRGSEIVGASVSATLGDNRFQAQFDDTGLAVIRTAACVS